jgi:hypothetical protein
LETIQKEQPNLIPAEVNVTEEFRLSRSFRRGSDSRAIEENLPEPTINLNNHWRKVEAAKGKQPTFAMIKHYADIQLVLGMFLRYSRAM